MTNSGDSTFGRTTGVRLVGRLVFLAVAFALAAYGTMIVSGAVRAAGGPGELGSIHGRVDVDGAVRFDGEAPDPTPVGTPRPRGTPHGD